MLFSILTLFPEIFPPVLNSSILGKAQKKKLMEIRYINIRDFSTDRHHTVDDKPYGGGIGMIMKVDIIDKALIHAKQSAKKIISKKNYSEKTYLLDPKGEVFNQKFALSLSKIDHLILICGHYEGVDSRIENLVDGLLSMGQFILTGGEIPAMAVLDAIARLSPGILKPQAVEKESFTINDMTEYPQFTRPPLYKGMKVPKILLSGNHREIKLWQDANRKKIKAHNEKI